MELIAECEFVVIPNMKRSPSAHRLIEIIEGGFLRFGHLAQLVVDIHLLRRDAVATAGIGGGGKDDCRGWTCCGDIGQEFHHCWRVCLAIEFSVIGFVGAKGENEDIGLDVGDLLHCIGCFVDEVGELSAHNPAMVVNNATLLQWNDFKAIKVVVILGGCSC